MEIIKMKDIMKSYGSKTVLNSFSLTICEGEMIAITGESGKGKTTILNIIGLLEGIDDGKFSVYGKENIKPNSSSATKIIREKISYLFQNFALIDEETVNYNLQLALRYVKGSKKEKKELIDKALELVGLTGYGKMKIYELSGGEQQRVSIARSILKPCEIILADEPTGSLDEKNRDIILDNLKRLNDEGKTIIIVTHDKYVAEQCKRVISI